MSSPPSETPSPVADDHTERLQQSSIEQLFAALQREICEGRSQTPKPSPKPSTLPARESGAEPTDNWTYQELEKLLSEDFSATGDATGIAGFPPSEDMASREEVFSMQHSEYVVEETGPETEALSVDDSDDAHSIPPLDMLEVVETIRQYEVEEPETGCLTEVGVIRLYTFVTDDTQVSGIAIQVSNDEDASIMAPRTRTQSAVSSPESVPTPILEYPVLSVSTPRSEGTLQASLPSAAVTIPAPIVADPSVPDPVPGDSSPISPVPIDPDIAPRLSIVTPLKASDHEPSQMSTGISGLFTPAQRSGVVTPVLLEGETAEPLRTPDNESDNDLLAVSTPPVDGRTSSDKYTGEEDGENSADKDLVWPDNSIEAVGPLSPNARQVGATVVDVDAQDPQPHSVQTDDDISSTPRGGSVASAVSPRLPTGDSSGTSLKYLDRPDGLASGGERHPDPGTDAEGDEDADGEADPDYPQEDAADVAVESEVASSKAGNGIRTCAENVPNLENSPAR